jgi:hypothetical protein
MTAMMLMIITRENKKRVVKEEVKLEKINQDSKESMIWMMMIMTKMININEAKRD